MTTVAGNTHDARPSDFADVATGQVHGELGFPCLIAASRGGLGVFAARHIDAGEIVITEIPFAITVSVEACHRRCAVCLADARRSSSTAWPHLCRGCYQQRYCSTACQQTAQATFHPLSGVECTGLAHAHADSQTTFETRDNVAHIIRILANRVSGASIPIGARARVGYDGYSRLTGVPASTPAEEQCRRACSRIATKALPAEARIPHLDLMGLLSRHASNVYGINGPGGEDIGSATFVGFMSLFNHSCTPNLALDAAAAHNHHASQSSHEPPAFSLVAIREVASGEELCITYLTASLLADAEGQDERRTHLKECYGFECGCSRCSMESTDIVAAARRAELTRCTAEECGTGICVPVTADDARYDAVAGCLSVPQPSATHARHSRCTHCGTVRDAGVG